MIGRCAAGTGRRESVLEAPDPCSQEKRKLCALVELLDRPAQTVSDGPNAQRLKQKKE